MRSLTASATRCCWAPSWRLRSMRRRSESDSRPRAACATPAARRWWRAGPRGWPGGRRRASGCWRTTQPPTELHQGPDRRRRRTGTVPTPAGRRPPRRGRQCTAGRPGYGGASEAGPSSRSGARGSATPDRRWRCEVARRPARARGARGRGGRVGTAMAGSRCESALVQISTDCLRARVSVQRLGRLAQQLLEQEATG